MTNTDTRNLTTKRSEIGELLFRLKNRSDKTVLTELVNNATDFIISWGIEFSGIIAMPPSKTYRTFQPVLAITVPLADRLGVPLLKSAVRKTKQVPELKNVFDPTERRRLLDDAFEVNSPVVEGKTLLLVDDLYRSGATMTAVTEVLLAGGASKVHAFAFTQTRTKT